MDVVLKLFLILAFAARNTFAFMKPTCSKDYLRFMVATACSYAKREVSNDDVMKVVEEEFDKHFDDVGNYVTADNEIFHAPLNYRNHKHWREVPFKLFKNKRTTDKFGNFQSDWQNFMKISDNPGFGRFRRLLGLEGASMPSGDIAGIPVPWMNREELHSKGINGNLLYRDIRDTVMKCCTRNCTVDEFKHLCG
ncbi:uncharacterized protein LOC106663401 [Cimex lectularius]|uniref:Insulin-like domain-containing protein n=1 Tax=Cimex lectularius TaxID=79782 RepID=A0A8I6REK7_CIMLE|nr:uncharacterized protein LOC106663401 [Cimex lectularius]